MRRAAKKKSEIIWCATVTAHSALYSGITRLFLTWLQGFTVKWWFENILVLDPHLIRESPSIVKQIFFFFKKTLFLLLYLCSYKPVLDYIDTQFGRYLEEELKIKRSLFNYHDTRIHVCLYFITPTGHSLKSLDLVTMKKLDSKVMNPTGKTVFVCLFVSSDRLLQYIMFYLAGEHYPCHCKGRHSVQEWTGQIKDQDHERAGQ